MEIIEVSDKNQVLKLIVDSNEESLFTLLKVYFESMKGVDLVGVSREHHLVDKTEFYLKVDKGSALEFFKKALSEVKKDLSSKKVK